MLAVWNQQKRIIRSKDQIFPLIKYKPFDGNNFSNGLDNTNKKFKVGKSWYIDMLRRKSNSDLEKLWYSLLKEKLAIQSDKYSLTQKNLRIRDEVRTAHSKVCVSMSRIKTVFGEREKINNEFNMLLEYWYIRNKQMSNNKFEVTKNISDWAKRKHYERTLLEDPKNKNKLMQEIKLLDNERDTQLKKTQDAVIQEKKKEIKLLKEEIQEKVLAKFILEQERLKKLKEKESPKLLEDEIKAVKLKLNELEKKRAQTQDQAVKHEATKSMKNLAAKLLKLKLKKQVESAKAEKEKQRASEAHSENAQEASSTNNNNQSAKSISNQKENKEHGAEGANKQSAERASANNANSSRDVVNFKKNANSKNQSTEVQKQKAKKPKNASATTEASSASNAEESAEQSDESARAAEAAQSAAAGQREALKKIDIEAYKQTLAKKQKKELVEKIKKTLRGKVTRLGVKYRAVLADHKKITLDKVAPYRRRLFNEMRNLDDITKVGYEYNVPKPNILEPVKVNVAEQKYQDILLGKIKAPVPYMKKSDNNNKKYVKAISRKEVSHAKSLIQRKNRRQVLGQYVKNVDTLSKTGKTNAYNKIQKIRAKQAQDIFLKELSALKHHLKQPNSFYKKFQKSENNKTQ